MHNQPDIFVIGTASLDVLHLADGRTVQAAGGAGLYTALAIGKAGANAGLFAPRPVEFPPALAGAAHQIAWVGPQILAADLPRLEIAHHGQGRATLLDASWGAEAQLTPAAMPAVVAQAAWVHIAALSSAARQLEFLQAIRAANPSTKISVGTYGRLMAHSRAQVWEIFRQADLFFMNENEATGLFGRAEKAAARPGALLFVTRDAAGADVFSGADRTRVTGHPVAEVDPTGAGDTFCGAVLAGLARGVSAVAAAQLAVKLAAQTVSSVGPAALLRDGSDGKSSV